VRIRHRRIAAVLHQRKPGEQGEKRHAAGEMRNHDGRLEQHRHGPFAERRLEHHQTRDCGGEPGRLARAPGRKRKGEDQDAEGAGEVAMAHFLPCLCILGRIGDRLAVAQRPVGAAEPGVGQAHVRAHHHHDEGEH
jgi:hypothetical protein